MFWAREFRRRVRMRKDARMSEIPDLRVPSIMVDESIFTRVRNNSFSSARDGPASPSASVPPSPLLSPHMFPFPPGGAPSASGATTRHLPPLDTNLRRRDSRASAYSEGLSPGGGYNSPSLSPHTSYLSQYDTAYHGARRGSSQSNSARSSPSHSRDNSTARGVMDSLETSAWGESIRRSFTQHRSQQGRDEGRS